MSSSTGFYTSAPQRYYFLPPPPPHSAAAAANTWSNGIPYIVNSFLLSRPREVPREHSFSIHIIGPQVNSWNSFLEGGVMSRTCHTGPHPKPSPTKSPPPLQQGCFSRTIPRAVTLHSIRFYLLPEASTSFRKVLFSSTSFRKLL